MTAAEKEHIVSFITTFIIRNKRHRYLFRLSLQGGWKRITERLHDCWDFEPGCTTALDPLLNAPDTIEQFLRESGAGDTCYALSEDRELDRRLLSLREGLERCLNRPYGTVLLLVPGRLAFYESAVRGRRMLLAKV